MPNDGAWSVRAPFMISRCTIFLRDYLTRGTHRAIIYSTPAELILYRIKVIIVKSFRHGVNKGLQNFLFTSLIKGKCLYLGNNIFFICTIQNSIFFSRFPIFIKKEFRSTRVFDFLSVVHSEFIFKHKLLIMNLHFSYSPDKTNIL